MPTQIGRLRKLLNGFIFLNSSVGSIEHDRCRGKKQGVRNGAAVGRVEGAKRRPRKCRAPQESTPKSFKKDRVTQIEQTKTQRLLYRRKIKYSSIAQSVEQRTVNPWVVGSSPTWGAKASRTISSWGFTFRIRTTGYASGKKSFSYGHNKNSLVY